MISDLRYPIGNFHYQGGGDHQQRLLAIGDIAAAPQKLREAVAGLSPDQLNTPYRPGGWTVRQLIHHLPDSHMNAYVRFKLALTEVQPRVKTYDEAKWAETPEVASTSTEVSLSLLEALHHRWTNLLRGLSDADFRRTLNHPELGLIDLDRYLAQYAWHGKHHVAHITALRDRMHW